MRYQNRLQSVFISSLLSLAAAGALLALAADPPTSEQPVLVGDKVPAFELTGLDGGRFFPAAHSSPLVLVFFRGVW